MALRVAFLRGDGLTCGYASPLLAAFMRPVHEYDHLEPAVPVWVEGDIERTDGLRTWLVQASTRYAPLALPVLTALARVAFAVLVARSVHRAPRFLGWADAWLSGRDRTTASVVACMQDGVAPLDEAYAAHWALMSALCPEDTTLPAQTAAIVAAYAKPTSLDFDAQAQAAVAIRFSNSLTTERG